MLVCCTRELLQLLLSYLCMLDVKSPVCTPVKSAVCLDDRKGRGTKDMYRLVKIIFNYQYSFNLLQAVLKRNRK